MPNTVMDTNPYAAPREQEEQPVQQDWRTFSADLLSIVCAGAPFIWMGSIFCVVFYPDSLAMPDTLNTVFNIAFVVSCMIWFVSAAYNLSAVSKRRWMGAIGLVVNLFSAILIGLVVAIMILSAQ